MKKVLCVIITVALLVCLCGCSNNQNDDYSSTEVEIIYQSDTQTVYGEDNAVNSDVTSSKDETNSSAPEVSQNVETSSIESSSTTETVRENICYLNDSNVLKNIKLNGRCQKTTEGIELNFTASAIEFNTDSTGVLLEVTADQGVYYSVFVDGKLTTDRAITQKGTNYIALARNLSAGMHNVKFVRAIEGMEGKMLTAVNLQLDEGKSISAAAQKDVLIEFLGDSLTSGYGNLSTSVTPNGGDIKYQNSLKAYPYLMADKLGFDYRIVSRSAIALKERIEATYKRPAFYGYYNTESYYKDKEQKYTSSNPQDVDIVVVNLGTNDWSKNWIEANNSAKINEYADIYTNLITNIGYRKDAKIVFVSGVGSSHAQKGAYDEAKVKLAALGYNNVYVYDCPTYSSGSDNHPSEKEHQIVADLIITFFKDNGIS